MREIHAQATSSATPGFSEHGQTNMVNSRWHASVVAELTFVRPGCLLAISSCSSMDIATLVQSSLVSWMGMETWRDKDSAGCCCWCCSLIWLCLSDCMTSNVAVSRLISTLRSELSTGVMVVSTVVSGHCCWLFSRTRCGRPARRAGL